jgi:hypothetical protein
MLTGSRRAIHGQEFALGNYLPDRLDCGAVLTEQRKLSKVITVLSAEPIFMLTIILTRFAKR